MNVAAPGRRGASSQAVYAESWLVTDPLTVHRSAPGSAAVRAASRLDPRCFATHLLPPRHRSRHELGSSSALVPAPPSVALRGSGALAVVASDDTVNVREKEGERFRDPIAGVAWLVNRPELAPRGLRGRDAVTTGTCTGIRPPLPGRRGGGGLRLARPGEGALRERVSQGQPHRPLPWFRGASLRGLHRTRLPSVGVAGRPGAIQPASRTIARALRNEFNPNVAQDLRARAIRWRAGL